MKKDQWKGNGGQGFRAADNQFYCCMGCAGGTGCTCKAREA
jgi:hypothetical protein